MRFPGLATIMVVGVCASATAETITLPSGGEALFLDVVTDVPGLVPTHRFRFVSPTVTWDSDYETTEADMAHLCRTIALPEIKGADPVPELIVITLADRAVPFGAPDPEAIQFFEAYTPASEDCIWRDF